MFLPAFLELVVPKKTLPSSAASPNCNPPRSEEHTSELQSRSDLVCRLLLEKKKKTQAPRSATRVRARADTPCTPYLSTPAGQQNRIIIPRSDRGQPLRRRGHRTYASA